MAHAPIPACDNHRADAVFGPVHAKLGERSGKWQTRGLFEKQVPHWQRP